MDTSDPAITFDAQGRCNHCRDYLARASLLKSRRREPAISSLIERIKRAGRHSAYDCIVGLSGGGDSSYVAWSAVKMGLRVLAVHMDNGWNSAVAVRNVKRVVDALDLDYVSVVLDWQEFRDLQLAFLRASVPEIETPTDIAIPGALHRVAAEYGVRNIISGGNVWTEGILPKAWHYDAKDLRYLEAIHGRFGTGRLRSFPRFGYLEESWYKLAKGIRFVYLMEFLPYTTAEITRLLRDELGWQPPGGKHHESTITRFVQTYVLPMKFGYDYRRATFSTQICAGELSRERALAELEEPPWDEAQLACDKQYVAKKFEVTEAELERILAQPPRTYQDYPNDQRFLEMIYGLYRAFFSRRRAAAL
jgi:N-acetyl sugar amidotransferase